MSQETFIYNERANSVLSVFKILIKKELMFFTNGCPSLATRVGAHLFTNWKSYVQLET